MAAGSTYTPIYSTTLGSAQSSVTLNSFSGYTDLVLITSASSDISADTNHILCRFNSDSGSNYSVIYMYGVGTSAMGEEDNTTGAYLARHHATEYAVGITNFLNYSNSTTYKTVLSRGSSGSSITILYANVWRNTAAITSMVLTPVSASNFDAGSTFTLYGITAA
jgi:hypothetical protein